ncbi:hypothetical protein CI610_00815 [invertebrate metagenome]|uniref:PepSY domain-containing protein n=1 Tax=invertebrate metagenome TaxID=1711999 RepID=A0A2H9TAE6_9ZZZZ
MKWSRNWVGMLFFCAMAVGVCQAAGVSSENNLSAINAIAAKVLKTYPGSIDSLSVEKHRGVLVYEVEVVNPETGIKSEIKYYADSGRMVLDDEDRMGGWDSAKKRFIDDKYRLLVESPVTLLSAVEKVMEKVPGQLCEAELEHNRAKGKVFFEIEVVTDTSIVKMFVDVKTGQFIAPVVDD